MDPKTPDFIKYSPNEKLMPQAEMLEKTSRKNSLLIGVPKETSFQEKRVSLVPSAISVLVENGHRVLVESDAGKNANFPNHEYSEAGAQIVNSIQEILQCDIVLKVAPLSLEEISLAKSRQIIISALHLTGQSEVYFKSLINKKITAISFEHIRDKTGSFPIMRSLSEIVGSASILIGAEYLAHPEYGKGKMLGGFSGIFPSEVIVIGAGNVGENAARVALGLGAVVKVFDNAIYKLRGLQNNLGTRLYTSILNPKVLGNALKTADVVIGALHSSNGVSNLVITENMIREMKQGSVIVDVSIDKGGICETSKLTSHNNPVFKVHGVTHYCVPNIASKVPCTASHALSNYFGPMMLIAGENGGIDNLIKADCDLRKGVYVYNGVITNLYISEYFKLPYQDIDLLMAAFHH